MKEIIEYILAAVIVLMIIPIYDYIVSTLYTPPQLKVEETVVYAFGDQVVSIINEAGLYGNLTSPLIDLADLVVQRLPYYTSEYGFRIEMVSNGIIDIVFDGSSIEIYTLTHGNISLLLIYGDGSIYNASLTSPYQTLDNGTYMYRYDLQNPGQLVFVAAVLDTQYYRYIDYVYVASSRGYIGNINNSLVLLINNTPLYTLPGGDKGLPIGVVSYSRNRFQVFNQTVKYGNIIGLRFIGIGWSWWYGLYIIYDVYYNSTSMKYYAILSSTINLNGVNYSLLPIYLVYNYTIDTVRYKYYLFVGKVENWLVDSEQYNLLKIPINAPIYNLPIIYARAPDEGIVVGIWYPHRLVFGENMPEGIPVTKVTMLRRIGMIDYYITIYMWRRTVT